MINIDKFIQQRKKLKFSQKELAKGICTQATLSRFENEGQIPSIKILEKLCQRLDLAVGDIFINSEQKKVAQNLLACEYAYLNYDYSKIYQLLMQIKDQNFYREVDQLHFKYLNGIYMLENNRDQASALFYFNSILDNDKHHLLYHLLALKGCGQVYETRRDFRHAKENYDLLYAKIKQIKISENDNQTAIQVLSILSKAGDFYGRHHYYKESNYLLRYAVQIGSEYHLPYYMGRIFYRLGINAFDRSSLVSAQKYLHDAQTFSRFNHDQYIFTKSRQTLEQITK